MRLFFGLEPDQCTAVQIGNWRDRQCPPVGRAVPLANLHVTLSFLGEVSPQRLERLCASVDSTMGKRPALAGTLWLDEIGFWTKPGILWLGPGAWPDSLSHLAARLARLGSAQGSRLSRTSFRPHITLFRGCTSAPPAPAESPSIEMQYSDFALFESRQGREGVRYQAIQRWPLQ